MTGELRCYLEEMRTPVVRTNGIKKSTNVIAVAYMQLNVSLALLKGNMVFLLHSGRWRGCLSAGRLGDSSFRDIGGPRAVPHVGPFWWEACPDS